MSEVDKIITKIKQVLKVKYPETEFKVYTENNFSVHVDWQDGETFADVYITIDKEVDCCLILDRLCSRDFVTAVVEKFCTENNIPMYDVNYWLNQNWKTTNTKASKVSTLGGKSKILVYSDKDEIEILLTESAFINGKVLPR